MPNLNIVICPGCASQLPADNRGCPDCGYENNDDGRLLTIAEILDRPSYPAPGAMRLNDVSPAFLKAVIAAATSTEKLEPGEEERPISADVRNIKLDGYAKLTIIQGAEPRLSIRCEDARCLSKVLTTVSGNTLTIDNEPTMMIGPGGATVITRGGRGGSCSISIQENRGLVAEKIVNIAGSIGGHIIAGDVGGSVAEVMVTLPQVTGLRIKGAGKVTYRGFSQDELALEISGSANVDLGGTTDRLEAEISGSGDVSAYELTAKAARLRVSGSGDIRATVTESVRARVSGSGKIKVAGNPAQRDTDVSGSGKIKFVDAQH